MDLTTGNISVHWGDDQGYTFTKNMDGSYTPPVGDFDTLVKNGNGTYTLTRKLGTVLNFGTNNKISTNASR